MSILPFDTLAYSKRLQEKGMPSSQAEEIVTVFREVLDQKDLATKADVQVESERIRSELRAEIEKVRSELTQSIEKVRSDLTLSIEHLRADSRADNEKLRAEVRAEIDKNRIEAIRLNHSLLKWIMGIAFSLGISVFLALARGFHWFGW